MLRIPNTWLKRCSATSEAHIARRIPDNSGAGKAAIASGVLPDDSFKDRFVALLKFFDEKLVIVSLGHDHNIRLHIGRKLTKILKNQERADLRP